MSLFDRFIDPYMPLTTINNDVLKNNFNFISKISTTNYFFTVHLQSKYDIFYDLQGITKLKLLSATNSYNIKQHKKINYIHKIN